MTTATQEITNMADMIDSRDVIDRIAALTEERADLREQAEESGDDTELREWEDLYEDELDQLEKLAEEAAGYAEDWKYGEALIRDSYFQDYAEELAEDIGAIQKGAAWPYTCIDWAQAARELQMDYTSVDFGGVTYWIR